MAKDTPIKPYRNQYVIYARKSTDDSDNQKNSIAYQKMEGLRLAKHAGLPIAPVTIEGFCTSGIISERHTGFKESEIFVIKDDGTVELKIERPKFMRMAKMLYNQEFKGVIFLCVDRSSRNESDNIILNKLSERGVDIRYVEVTYEKNSSGALHMRMDGAFAIHYSNVISEKVTRVTRKLRAEGICTYRAPVGYLNTGDSRNKPFDPERAPLIKQLFEKCDEENWSLNDLRSWAIEQGLTMPPVRRQRTDKEMLSDDEMTIEAISRVPTTTVIHKILTNQFYIGKVKKNSKEWVQSISHEALVDAALFQRVQQKLTSRKITVKYSNKISYPYRGILRCTLCNRVYTPYEQKGITYYGVRCMPDCPNSQRNINIDFFEKQVALALTKVQFTDAELEEIKSFSHIGIKDVEKARKKLTETLARQQKKMQEDLQYLTENKLLLLKTGVYTPESYLSEEAFLQKKHDEISIKMQEEEVSIQEMVESAATLSELLKHLCILYKKAKTHTKQKITDVVFSELKLADNNFEYKGKNGFEVLDMPFLSLCGPKYWLSEPTHTRDQIQLSIDEVQVLEKEFEDSS